MVICTVEVNEKSPQTIVIGRRGTYNTQEIVFDIGYLIDAYGAGTAVLAIKRSQDSSAYPTVVTQEDTTLTWTVSETDTYYVGAGECQLMWYVDGGLAKTIIYSLVVMRDILSTSEEAPDAYQEWVDNLTALGAETLQNAQDAAQSASNAESAKDDAVTAKEAAENAKGAAEEAQQAAETAVTHYPKIVNNYWYVWANGEWVNTGVKAEGVDGRGIVSVTGQKTSTVENVDTYTMTVAYTSGNPDTFTFTVTNGVDGYSPVVTITAIIGGHRVTITDETHPTGQSFDVMDGENGAVLSVAGKTGAVTLDANDVAFSESGSYDDGTVGKELSDQKNAISQKAPVIINTASGDIASFADGADGMQIRKIVGTIVPQQSGTGDPSPDNVRPISGWTGANIEQAGKNLINVSNPYTVSSNDLINSGRLNQAFDSVKFKENTQYNIKFTYSSNGTAAWGKLTVTYTDGTTSTSGWFTTGADYSYVSTANKTIERIRFTNYNAYVALTFTDFMIAESTVATDYEPYIGTTIPITFPTTIYGGSDEVIGGALESTMGMVDLGDLNWSKHSSSGNFFATISDIKPFETGISQEMLSSMYRRVSDRSTAYAAPDGSMCRYNSSDSKVVIFSNSNYETAADFKAAMSGVQLCYELASPIEYTLTANELNTLYGTNNVWIDCGSISECNYPADTKLYIDGLTEPDEDMIANANIASGKYFVVNNQLYLSTAAIAAGASIVPGTNCTATSLAEALNAINT